MTSERNEERVMGHMDAVKERRARDSGESGVSLSRYADTD